MNLKSIRDKINGSDPLKEGETLQMFIDEWDYIHNELEALKAEDERNYISCGVVENEAR
jgi:hypothetical protein